MAQPVYTYSGVCYTATAGQDVFSLTSTEGNPIGYLSPAHIHVRVSVDNGKTWDTKRAATAFTFNNPATSIRLTTPATVGEWIDIRRITPTETDWVDFKAGSLLTAEQLNEAELFSLYCDQEIIDGVRNGTIAPEDPGVMEIIAGSNVVIDPTDGKGSVTISSVQVDPGVTKIKAGENVEITPSGGTGEVTIKAIQPDPVDPGVTKIIAGDNIQISPSDGTGTVTITGQAGGGGVPEAPDDGKQYGRQSETWTEIVGAEGGGLVYKGTIDVTGAAPAGLADGDFYVNTTDGSAGASWTGIGGEAVIEGDRVAYNGSSWQIIPSPGSGAVDSVNGQIGVVSIGVEQLDDFAYYPASNEGFLEGPLVAATPVLSGSEYFCGMNGNNAVIWFSKENRQLYDILSTLEVGNALSVFYSTSYGGYGWNLRKDTTFVDLGFNSYIDNWAVVVSGNWTGIAYEDIGQDVPGQPDSGPIRFESAFITNGSEPIKDGQALIYDKTTDKWRPEDISGGGGTHGAVKLAGDATTQTITGTGGLATEGLLESGGGVKVTGGTPDTGTIRSNGTDLEFYGANSDKPAFAAGNASSTIRYGLTASGVSNDTKNVTYQGYNVKPVASPATYQNIYNVTINDVPGNIANFKAFNVDGSQRGNLNATNNYAFFSHINPSTNPGSNAYNFYAQGTAPNYFAGNVGILAIDPKAKLDINGDTTSTKNSFFASNIYYQGGWKYKNDGYGGFVKLADNGGGMSFGICTENISGEDVEANPTTAMFIKSTNAQVGIGNTNPKAKLEVTGTILSTPVSFTSNQDQPYLIAGTSDWTGDTTNWSRFGFQHRIKTNSNGVPRVTLDTINGEAYCVSNNNNVGIGAEEPQAKLEVNGDAIRLHNVAVGSAELSIYNGGALAEWMVGQESGTSHNFQIRKKVANTYFPFFSINVEGNVGISVTEPQAKLDVDGTVKATGFDIWDLTELT